MALRCEEALGALIPTPPPSNMDALLQQQKDASRVRRRASPKRVRNS
ncbi:MAG: hypothetical protein JNM47_08485 [Hyphomonadaceae bacterium]|nr:hypothetical protein [Hyphomonadaceae bacterium]